MIDTIIAVCVVGMAVILSILCAIALIFIASAYSDWRKNVSKQKTPRDSKAESMPSMRETRWNNRCGTFKSVGGRQRKID